MVVFEIGEVCDMFASPEQEWLFESDLAAAADATTDILRRLADGSRAECAGLEWAR